MAAPIVGLLSPGDMGHVVAQVLQAHGVRVRTCLAGRSERTRQLARRAQIEEVASEEELVRTTEIILSIVVPAAARAVAERVARALQVTGRTLVYVDCNAVSPRTVREIATCLTATGSRFVDASIIGPPPRQAGTTRFYASGPDVEAMVALGQYGLDVRVVGEEIGQASALKMCYAALTKGFTALATALLVAAQAMGLYEALVDEFALSQAERYRAMQRQIPPMPTKARRWVGEMEEIAHTFAEVGLTPLLHQGAAEVYRFVSTTPLAEETPETLDRSRTLEQVIATLAAHLPPATVEAFFA
ncbi:MAG: 6-phosphogluconate dehydrogenase [Candidatus Tectimicrobiota bacterium]|nr:MAG: 6-phosphogluconate dehydrogenase [Candidatus Tectomicrobia bacterium]